MKSFLQALLTCVTFVLACLLVLVGLRYIVPMMFQIIATGYAVLGILLLCGLAALVIFVIIPGLLVMGWRALTGTLHKEKELTEYELRQEVQAMMTPEFLERCEIYDSLMRDPQETVNDKDHLQ